MATSRPTKPPAGPRTVFQLKVTLKDTKPPIWRRLVVRGDVRLSSLHDILQIAMGWTNSHLHLFDVHGTFYGEPDPDDFMEMKNEERVRLVDIVGAAKDRFTYQYDFGDNWDHAVVVEKVTVVTEKPSPPICLAGRRACPPEDVGGVWGYVEFLAAIADPEHEEHESYLEWVGGAFDPDALDLTTINARLARLR